MYDFIAGDLVEKTPTRVVIDAGGVGYAFRVPVSTYESLPGNGRVRLFVHLHVREDALELFGFASVTERQAFEKLVTVRGIGPGLAITVLSGIPVRQLAQTVADGNVDALSHIKGIGRKTAERIVVDLRDTFVKEPEPARPPGEQNIQDAVAALVSLGYSHPEARKAVQRAAGQVAEGADVEELVRTALSA